MPILGAPDIDHGLVGRRVDALAREGQVAHFNAQAVELLHFTVQFLAITAIGVGKHRDMGLRLLGCEHHHLVARQGIDLRGDGRRFSLLGQVPNRALLDLVQIALQQEFATLAGIQHPPALELNLIDALERAFGNGFDGQVRLQGGQRLTDGLIGITSHGQRSGNQGQGGKKRGNAHGYSRKGRYERSKAYHSAPFQH
ncbi:hypothetical protein D3C77_572850 [compost metagenome]